MKKNGDYIKSFEANGRSVAASASKKLYDDDVDDDEDDDDDEDATHHGGDDEEKETAIKQRDRSGSFPRKVWAMINAVEKTHPDILRWEKDGEAFYIDKDHAKITQILRKHMKCTFRENKQFWFLPLIHSAQSRVDTSPPHSHTVDRQCSISASPSFFSCFFFRQ